MYYALSDRQSDRQRARTTDPHRLVSVVDPQGIKRIHDLQDRPREPTAVRRIAGLDTV